MNFIMKIISYILTLPLRIIQTAFFIVIITFFGAFANVEEAEKNYKEVTKILNAIWRSV